MAHANAPLTPEGRRRLIERIILDGRPISHVAAEAGVSRQRLSIWLPTSRENTPRPHKNGRIVPLMRCSQCHREIARDEQHDRLDAGVRLSDGTVIGRDVNLHDQPCSGEWWSLHYPHLRVSVKVYERA